MRSVPSEKEINIFDTSDERSAVRNFLGKNLIEAENLFSENFLNYQEDLMWMGPKAFEYYAIAAISYLRSVDLNEKSDDDFALFCSIIDFRLKSDDTFKKIAKQILEKPVNDFLELDISENLRIKFNGFLELLNV